MMTGYVADRKGTKNAAAHAAAQAMHEDWVREWGEGGHFVAVSLKCGCCGRWFVTAMPEDMDGASVHCPHCHDDLVA